MELFSMASIYRFHSVIIHSNNIKTLELEYLFRNGIKQMHKYLKNVSMEFLVALVYISSHEHSC
jgi:predicted nuclease of predicted toxin-antitoxin system